MNKKNMKKGYMPFLALFILMLSIFYLFEMLNIKINDLSYNEFMKEVEEGNVVEVFISPQSRTGVYQISGKLEGYEEDESFLLEVPLSNESLAIIYEAQAEQLYLI